MKTKINEILQEYYLTSLPLSIATQKMMDLFESMQPNDQLIAFCNWYKTTDFNCEGNSSEDCVNEYLKHK